MTFRMFLIGVLLLIAQHSVAQRPHLTENSRISLLTCAAGEELYYAFGHSAFRVQDAVLGIDVVYNYGTFDFTRPNFYLNFVKGQLLYSLSRSPFEDFLWTYEQEKRWVREQVLALTLAEKNQLFSFFETNYLPQNRDYLYDPLFNNCASITRDILKSQFGDAMVFHDSHLEQRYTFRQLIRQYIPPNTWAGFGIDVLFGAVVDRKATVQEYMFLPYYAMRQIRNTTKAGKPLLQEERVILEYEEHRNSSFFLLSPLFVSSWLLLFIGIITYRNLKRGTQSRWLDFGLFLIPGLVGLGLLLLWWATDHVVTVTNFDVLWAFPLNLIVAFVVGFQPKPPQWLRYYLKALLGLLGLLVLLWITEVQQFSPVLVPLLLTLALRYSYLLKSSSEILDIRR